MTKQFFFTFLSIEFKGTIVHIQMFKSCCQMATCPVLPKGNFDFKKAIKSLLLHEFLRIFFCIDPEYIYFLILWQVFKFPWSSFIYRSVYVAIWKQRKIKILSPMKRLLIFQCFYCRVSNWSYKEPVNIETDQKRNGHDYTLFSYTNTRLDICCLLATRGCNGLKGHYCDQFFMSRPSYI